MDVDIQQLENLNSLFVQVMSEIFLSPHSSQACNDLTGAQKKILYLLAMRGPHKMSDIARQVSVSVTGATGVVDRLVRMGLVERDYDPSDRRVILIKLTPSGRETFDELQTAHQRRLEEVLGALEPAKRVELIACFERIHGLLTELRECHAVRAGSG